MYMVQWLTRADTQEDKCSQAQFTMPKRAATAAADEQRGRDPHLSVKMWLQIEQL